MESLWFYGMAVLAKNGIKPDLEKVVAIRNTPPPNNVTELRSFPRSCKLLLEVHS